MSPGNRVQLLALADREFRQMTNARPKPAPDSKFKAIKLNPARFDNSWDRKRGAAVRLTSVVLRHDDITLAVRVCENEKTAKTYADAADWLQRESAYLRKVARLLETAASRLAIVLTRCQGTVPDAG